MRTIIRGILGLFALLGPSPVLAAATAAATFQSSGPPPGFEQLEQPREVLVDLYFGDRKIGDAFATAKQGTLRFSNAQDVIATIPNLKPAPELVQALTGDLPTNSNLVCSKTNAAHCGSMAPPIVSIIYDEDRFRADIFVAPRYLGTVGRADPYLSAPTAPLSITSSLGAALSGATVGTMVYNLQNRTVLGDRNARIRMTSSVASHLGWMADELVGEVDRRDMRYSAGLFWAPGMDFTGQRRILGVGFGTQFDTLADRASIEATPLILFLAEPSRVEILVDGRLVTSGAYEAGNNELDSSALPDGAYTILLRIRSANGSVREERRFFVKNSQVAPIGRPIYFGYAGVLANSEPHRLVSASRSAFYQLGGAWRLSRSVALDVGAMGTNGKTLVEAGAWLIAPLVRLRAAALASTAGDKGLLLQLGSGGHGPLNFTFDLRRIWTHRDQILFPLPSYVISFDSTAPTAPQLGNGSYKQATGSLGYRLGPATLSLVGSYRADRGLPSDYSIGPSVDLPLLNHNGLQLMFTANAQRTSTTTAAFAGFQLLFNRGRLAVSASAGGASLGARDGTVPPANRAVGSLGAQYSSGGAPGTELSITAGADRNVNSSTVHASGTFDSRLADVRADVLHNLETPGGTQFGITVQSGAAASTHGMAIGANDVEQSAVILSVSGDARDVPFNVLVDDHPKGRIRIGERLSLFLPPYRAYRIRLVPSDSDPVMFDASTRTVTLYPGNVQTLRWTAQSYFTVFGQAISQSHKPIANALVRAGRSISESDSNGYFQIDVVRGDRITLGELGLNCDVDLGRITLKDDYAPIGKVVCK